MDKKPYPSETQERFIVRFPNGMRDRIAEAAKDSNRSMNAEIISRIQSSFDLPLMKMLNDEVNRSDGRIGQIQHLTEMADAQRKTIAAQDVNIIMLQAYLLEMINAMPKGMRSDERVKIATKFALQPEYSGKPAPYQVPLQLKDPGHPYEVGRGLVPEATPSKMSAPPKRRTAAPQKKQ